MSDAWARFLEIDGSRAGFASPCKAVANVELKMSDVMGDMMLENFDAVSVATEDAKHPEFGQTIEERDYVGYIVENESAEFKTGDSKSET